MFKSVPRKYHPPGFDLLYEDQDIIVGNKAPGLLTVEARWNKNQTAHGAVNTYIRKGAAKSTKSVFVVHRLDQATSGVLVFAKNEAALNYLKANWKTVKKTYLAIVHRTPEPPSGLIESYLSEDEDYHMHSSSTAEPVEGALRDSQLAQTGYRTLLAGAKFSLMELDLLTGRKNQIRVHMAELKHPIVGDAKYGPKEPKNRQLMLHSYRLEITHPFSKKRLTFEAKPPRHFQMLVPYQY